MCICHGNEGCSGYNVLIENIVCDYVAGSRVLLAFTGAVLAGAAHHLPHARTLESSHQTSRTQDDCLMLLASNAL